MAAAAQAQQSQNLAWKFRREQGTAAAAAAAAASSSDSDTYASSQASGWEAASSSAPSPTARRHTASRRHTSNFSGGGGGGGGVRRGGGSRLPALAGYPPSSSSSGAEDNGRASAAAMASAAELLYQRRSRTGRLSSDLAGISENSAPRRPRSGSGSGSGSGSNASNHNHHHLRTSRRSNHHYDPDYHNYYHCHGSLRFRNFLHQVSEADQEDNLSEHTSSSSILREETSSGQSRMNFFSAQAVENNNLPGAVMQARNRLYERFRAPSLSRNRLTRTDSIAAEFAYHVRGITLSDVGSMERERITLRNRWIDDDVQLDFAPTPEPKPQGLSQKGINGLPKEVFIPKSSSGGHGYTKESSNLEQEECPVCLESFLPGEQLTRLGCRHRFHPVCLNPWLRICGDCPYCRANVL